MEIQKPYTVLVLLNAKPHWLALTRDQRSEFVEKELVPIFDRVSKNVSVRFFDSEYFHASISDFLILNATELEGYKLFIELLRDTKVYSIPYFEIKDIIIGQENLFEDFNEQFKRDAL
ncbi:darcynin family protein [Algoriphagus sp. Y33]|uniref:darcynin family protein n=1 Tax=Algoriphagus sp. Y33 TaxID=2772483 RepID=UPI001783F7EB|nr:darcynin family protein [Algoriphagus sp. Y33]